MYIPSDDLSVSLVVMRQTHRQSHGDAASSHMPETVDVQVTMTTGHVVLQLTKNPRIDVNVSVTFENTKTSPITADLNVNHDEINRCRTGIVFRRLKTLK